MEHLVTAALVCAAIIAYGFARVAYLRWKRRPVQGPPKRFGNVGKR